MEIQIKHLDMVYPSGRQALRDVSLDLKSPNLMGLLGPNGAGKSTLMRLLTAGLLQTRGEITVDGRPLRQAERALKARLGYLPQSFGLYDELTVYQFLDYMAAMKGIAESKAAIREAIRAANLEEKERVRIRALSGGQRQRVGIAQALLGDPQLLILDEPTVGLDPEERISFRGLFSRMAQDRLVLLSTHIIEDVQSVCGQLIVIHRGRLRFIGAPAALIAQAQGHVGVFQETDRAMEAGLRVTSRVNTAGGVVCRAVAEELPPYVQPAEPTLEDAYLYLISQEAAQ